MPKKFQPRTIPSLKNMKTKSESPEFAMKERLTKRKGESRRKYGYWRKSQQEKYITFVRTHYLIMGNAQLRSQLQIFRRMAAFVGSRDAVQCKSHHQKMLMRTNNRLQSIIKNQQIRGDHVLPEYVFGELKGGIKAEHLEKIKTSEDLPYFMVKSNGKLLVVIDQRFMDCY